MIILRISKLGPKRCLKCKYLNVKLENKIVNVVLKLQAQGKKEIEMKTLKTVYLMRSEKSCFI